VSSESLDPLGQIAQTSPLSPVQITDEIQTTAMFSPVSNSPHPNPIQATMKISQIMDVMIENAIRHVTPELLPSFISKLLSSVASLDARRVAGRDIAEQWLAEECNFGSTACVYIQLSIRVDANITRTREFKRSVLDYKAR